MVTGDKNLSYQQNLAHRRLALIMLQTNDWNILKHQPEVVAVALEQATPNSFQVVRFPTKPRL